MKTNRVLNVFSIIFECSFAGAVILYGYNYYMGLKKYDVIPEALQNNLNTFIVIGITSAILAIIIRFILYMRKPVNKEVHHNIAHEQRDYSKNIEEAVTERVIIYKDNYEIPKENRMLCPNCKSIIDKNAFICLKCGFLLKPIVERRVTRVSNNIEGITKKQLINILINTGLVIAIIVCLLLIINIAMERGIIG